MDAGASPRTTHRCLPRALVLGLLCVSLLVAAAATGAFLPRSRSAGNAIAAHSGRLSVFLWISVASILSAWTTLWLFHASSRVRMWIAKWNNRPGLDQSVPGRNRIVLYVGLSMLTLALGLYGLRSPSSSNRVHPSWPHALSTALAAAWVLAAVAFLVMGVITAVRENRPGQETPPVLVLLRCSCCSAAVQRAAVALPFVALALGSVLLLQQALGADPACEAAKEPRALLLGSATICCSIVVVLASASALQTLLKRPLSSRVTRRLRHATIFMLLLLFGVVSIFWAVKSWQWLGGQERSSSCVDARTVRSVRFLAGALLTMGTALVTMTSCCRLERHLLQTANTPHVELAMLSPHAIRPPALTNSLSDRSV